MNADSSRMHRLTLRFSDAGLEAAYAEEQARKAVRPVRIALVFRGAGAVAFYVLTVYVFHRVLVTASPSVIFRAMLITLALCGAFYALTHRPLFVKQQQLIMFLLVCIASVGATLASVRMPVESLESRGWLMLLLRHGFAPATRGTFEVEGKSEMHTFLLTRADGSTHSVKGTEK